MARARSPEREQTFRIYKEHGGDISNREIARRLNLLKKTVGGWKYKDKWEEQLNIVTAFESTAHFDKTPPSWLRMVIKYAEKKYHYVNIGSFQIFCEGTISQTLQPGIK